MNYKIYKLSFITGVHIGKQSLEDSEITLCADTVFSALCQEALKGGKENLERLMELAGTDRIRISDAFPYMGEEYYLPKPITASIISGKKGNSSQKKAFKKLKYVPYSKLDAYLQGRFEPEKEQGLEHLGAADLKTVSANRGLEETEPYRIGSFWFTENSGLYLMAAYLRESDIEFLEELLEGISYAGIGGKRSAGFGRFQLKLGKIPQGMMDRMEKNSSIYMSLTVSLPRTEEMEKSLEQANYLIKKRSGFIASKDYADQNMRKKDLYMLAAGSCFTERYSGDVYDVSHGGKHPVYRYGKPIFMAL